MKRIRLLRKYKASSLFGLLTILAISFSIPTTSAQKPTDPPKEVPTPVKPDQPKKVKTKEIPKEEPSTASPEKKSIPEKKAEVTAELSLSERLDKPTGFDIEYNNLATTLNRLRKQLGIRIEIENRTNEEFDLSNPNSQNALLKPKNTLTLESKNMPLNTALDALSDNVGLIWANIGGVIYLGTKEHIWCAIFEQKITFKAEGSFNDVFSFLQDKTGFNLVLDPQVEKSEAFSKACNYHFRQASLASVIIVTCELADVVPIYHENILLITTKARAKKLLSPQEDENPNLWKAFPPTPKRISEAV